MQLQRLQRPAPHEAGTGAPQCALSQRGRRTATISSRAVPLTRRRVRPSCLRQRVRPSGPVRAWQRCVDAAQRDAGAADARRAAARVAHHAARSSRRVQPRSRAHRAGHDGAARRAPRGVGAAASGGARKQRMQGAALFTRTRLTRSVGFTPAGALTLAPLLRAPLGLR